MTSSANMANMFPGGASNPAVCSVKADIAAYGRHLKMDMDRNVPPAAVFRQQGRAVEAWLCSTEGYRRLPRDIKSPVLFIQGMQVRVG